MVDQIAGSEVKRMLAAGESVYLIDVREPWEPAQASLPNSLLIPLNLLRARVGEIQPPKGALVVVYCHHGIRSLTAAALLGQMGIERVASLSGGIDAWSREVDPRVPRY